MLVLQKIILFFCKCV